MTELGIMRIPTHGLPISFLKFHMESTLPIKLTHSMMESFSWKPQCLTSASTISKLVITEMVKATQINGMTQRAFGILA